MSVMSTAETGSSPDIPRRRLRVATPMVGPGDDGPAANLLDDEAGAEPGPAPSAPSDGGPWLAATELQATELRVREVRVVREASVRTLRAGGSRAEAVQARMASEARAARILAVTQARPAAQARPAGAQARPAAGAGAAAQTWVVTHRRAATRTRATRTRTVSHRPQRPGAVRLTRRGRLVVAGFVVLVIVAVTLLWTSVAGGVQASSRGGAAARSPYQGMTQIVVRPGQTLWSIAAAAEPSANAWAVVQQITEVNALNGAEVYAGELLWVPKG